MKKKLSIYSACLAITCAALSGCSDSNESREVVPSEMTRHSEALFGEVGGEPWNTETTLKAKSEVADLKLGSRIAVGKFDGTNMGVAMSNSKYFEHSTVQYALLDSEGSVRAEGVIEGPNASDETDSFGYDVVAGNYCASLGKSQRSGDILFVSAPSSSASSMYGGAVSIYGYKAGKWNEVATLSSKVDGLFGGMAIAIGDVNGDNKDDLVYFGSFWLRLRPFFDQRSFRCVRYSEQRGVEAGFDGDRGIQGDDGCARVREAAQRYGASRDRGGSGQSGRSEC